MDTAPTIRATMVAAMVAVLAWIVVGVPPAAAEWFADLYGGGNITESRRFSLDVNVDDAAAAGFIADVKFEKSFTVGGRVGYWFESLKFFGVGLDASHFRPDINPQTARAEGTIVDKRGVLFGVPIDVDGAAPVRLPEVDLGVTAVSLDLMLRWPMFVSANFPHGQLQPYLTVGAPIYLVELQGFHPSGFDPKTAIGVKGGGGVILEFLRRSVCLR